MPISRKRKEQLVAEYSDWLAKSQAVIFLGYQGLTTGDLQVLRRMAREKGGRFRVVKNTLLRIALEKTGMPVPAEYLVGTVALGFAFEDAPGLAKGLLDFAKENELLVIKGGLLGQNIISADDVKSLSEMPSLDTIRMQLLGLLNAPATRLVTVLNRPAADLAGVLNAVVAQLPNVLKAYSEKEQAA